jgi:lysozyme family protein
MSDDELLEAILRREGARFSVHPADPGGPSKFGITQATLARSRGRPVDTAEVAHLSEAEARAIYRALYIEEPGFGKIQDPRLRALVVDAGVLHGVKRAARWLQEALGGLEIDGVIGARTLAAVNGLGEGETREARKRLLARRYRALAAIVAGDASQAAFLPGWIARCNEFLLEL